MAHNLEKWLGERLTKKRYKHSLAVKERAVLLAKLYGENEEKATLAGLLHDCCKCLPEDEQLKIIKSRDILIDDLLLSQPQLWHGPAASAVLEEELQIHDADVLSAIRLHSTGAREMTRLEQIIYLADLTSADRSYPDVKDVRKLSEKNLAQAMTYCLGYIIGMLIDDKKPIVRDTWEAYNYFWRLSEKNKA